MSEGEVKGTGMSSGGVEDQRTEGREVKGEEGFFERVII